MYPVIGMYIFLLFVFQGPITTDFDVDIDCCLCYSLNDVKAGDPFYISYSSHRDNLNILVHMGFLPEGNENDCVFVRLEITQKDPLYVLPDNVFTFLYLFTDIY